ncbi:hypothetical protein [Candidatus Hakubella thermalkaliphila]|uniref:Uncharacterized protein n=1 Tax=Candidatus Hakubella thermalkaliphila TaxID=2754717 RepID=A0A6V8Q3S1_9ACTN|nr:hypothetical protein [Candidatus Hakubella thermalkaliphila]GFP39368.1 hypothetical protein HKBW3S47_01067 [Candidatus Hakubella thermalkaliphila]
MRVDSKGIKLAIEDVFCFLSKSLIYEKEAYRIVAEGEEIEDPDNSPELLWHIKNICRLSQFYSHIFRHLSGFLPIYKTPGQRGRCPQDDNSW